jgi:hypothetical protein
MTIRSWLLLLPAGVLAALAAGCSGDSSGTTGAMGQSTTAPDCAPDDTACQNDGLSAPIAEGARLPINVHVTAKGVAAPQLTLESAKTDVVAVENGTLVGKGTGFASVLMIGTDGMVLDFVTMTVQKPERLEIYRLVKDGGLEPAPLPAKIQIAPGDDFEISVKAFKGATRLLGELDATWTVDNGAVMLLDGGRAGSRRIRAKSGGTAKLSIKSQSFEKTLELEVLP